LAAEQTLARRATEQRAALVAVAMRMLAAAVRILPVVVEVGWAVHR
jgi:hypothetical protein